MENSPILGGRQLREETLCVIAEGENWLCVWEKVPEQACIARQSTLHQQKRASLEGACSPLRFLAHRGVEIRGSNDRRCPLALLSMLCWRPFQRTCQGFAHQVSFRGGSNQISQATHGTSRAARRVEAAATNTHRTLHHTHTHHVAHHTARKTQDMPRCPVCVALWFDQV